MKYEYNIELMEINKEQLKFEKEQRKYLKRMFHDKKEKLTTSRSFMRLPRMKKGGVDED